MSAIHQFFLDMLQPIQAKLMTELPIECTYHSAKHTLDVLEQAEVVGRAERLTEDELALVKIAALFHDVGFVVNRHNHEEQGCKILREFAKGRGLSERELNIIEGCIMATKIPQNPTNILEKVICDADLDYLGREDFHPIADLLFQELTAFGDVKEKSEWDQIQIRFLTNHRYHTDYAKSKRSALLLKNIETIKQRLQTYHNN